MEKSFEIIACISETALWFASSLQPLCPRDQQAHTQPGTCQHHKWGCQMGLPRELCSGVKQQWGERRVLYMLLKTPSWEELKTRRDFWHGYLVHWLRYSCAKTVWRCLIAFSFGKISVIWYWYPYTAIFHVYMYIERDFCRWLLQFTILYHCSQRVKFHLVFWALVIPSYNGHQKTSLSSSNYIWKEEWHSIPVWKETGYVFP